MWTPAQGKARELLSRLNELRSLCDVDPRTGQSVKLERIKDILCSVAAEGEKAVVFSYLLDPLNRLAAWLDQQDDLGYVILLGDLGLDVREKALNQFLTTSKVRFLLASTRVGGEGLNLVEANHVIFINRWWNPSANAQAKDRVSRMGQTRTVVVHSFSCRDTIEDLLDHILDEKQRLTSAIIEPLVDPINDPSIFDEIRNTLGA